MYVHIQFFFYIEYTSKKFENDLFTYALINEVGSKPKATASAVEPREARSDTE